MASERSVKEWFKLLKKDPDPQVRRRAAEALGALDVDRADGKLVAIPLIHALGYDSDNSVREAAARALGALRSRRAVRTLKAALRSDVSVAVRSGAAAALGMIGDPRAIDDLIFVLKRHKAVAARRAAALALGRFESEKAYSALTGSLKMDPSFEVRHSAATSLEPHLPMLTTERREEIEPLIEQLLQEPVEEEIPEGEETVRVVSRETTVKVAPRKSTVSSVKSKLRCPHCGRGIRKEAEVCSKCKKPLSRCMICHKVIKPGEVFAACPQCGMLAHREHLRKWLRIKSVCPHCQHTLRRERYD